MDFAFPAEVSAFRQEFGRYLDASVTPELLEECRTAAEECPVDAIGDDGSGPRVGIDPADGSA